MSQSTAQNPHMRIWRRSANAGILLVIVSAVIALYQFWSLSANSPLRSGRVLKVDDQGLRQLVLKSQAPKYPSASLFRKVTGVAVATVTIDVEGRIKRVEIIEAPDDATGEAVRDAVRDWTFRPVGVPVPYELITGNMIFYFHLSAGRGMVLSSEELQAIKGIKTQDPDQHSEPLARNIDEAEFRRLGSKTLPIVLDTRSRLAHSHSHREGAVNIPLAELGGRASVELPHDRLIVVDCSTEQQHADVCGIAIHILASQGFSELAVLSRNRD